MDPRLRLHNAVIGLAHPNPPWPQPLADAGYRIARIEQPIGTEAGQVTVDLLFVADERSAILAIECKDGTVQEEQTRRYDAMTPLDVVQTGGVSLRTATAAVLDIAYAVQVSEADKTLASLDRLSVSPGVVSIGPRVEWAGNPPKDPRLAGAFSEGIAADVRAIPRLLLVDDASHPTMLAPELANALLAVLQQGRESITVDALIENACWGWARYGRAVRGQFRRGVQEMLRDGQQNELHDLIRVEGAGRHSDPTLHLTPPTSAAATQAGELREARAIRARLNSFVARVTGKPVPEAIGQLTLEEIDQPDEDESDEDE